jgi:type VI secretion system protein
MISGRSLLRRIDDAAAGRSAGRLREEDPGRVLQGVVEHLQDLFNVRQGSAMSCPDYGLPDFNDLVHQSPMTIEVELSKAIKEAVRRYEPRLTAVRVKHIADPEDPLNLAFQISGRLNLGDKRRPVMFETVVTESGRIRVQA